MLKNEIKALKCLFGDLSTKPTISGVVRELNQKYFQTYRTIKQLEKLGLVNISPIGKSKIIELDLSRYHPEYALIEIERSKEACKNKKLSLVLSRILEMNKQFVCLLFGSYSVGKQRANSDIDLLFVIPEEYDYGKFEKLAKSELSLYNSDISITTEKGLLEMWSRPKQLNVGNELLKKHIVLFGAERFINLLRQHNVG
ncbi:MAG: nucleotidyltransferase domain-containing protein [Candidatus Woesearchaeota archaeon]